MKVFALTTGSSVCMEVCNSLVCLGHDVHRVIYDYLPDRHTSIIESVKKAGSIDCIVYIGGVEANPKPDKPPACPDATTLRVLRDTFAPTIHFCCDASHPDWWPLLDEFHEKGCFNVQVGVDGSFETPIARYGLVLLKPQDPNVFKPKPWHDRQIVCSFLGGANLGDGTPKSHLLQEAQGAGVQIFKHISRPYEAMANAMCDSKMTFNVAFRDSLGNFHVKWRVLEAGLAGSILLEQKGAQTEYWFERNRDYLSYTDIHEVKNYLALAKRVNKDWIGNVDFVKMAERLRAKILMDHHPSIFWQKVFWRAGVR